jgi:membrane-associated protease RseP (regulator of RpoE activity)
VHIVLFLLTVLVTTAVGALHYHSFISEFGRRQVPLTWASLIDGLWYSLTLLGILGAHEFGHYYFCRRYNIDASLPYFIPAPLPLTGTLGAVIRIRDPFPNRTILFDIGVGGPIAGFLVLVPALFVGMSMSHVVAVPTGPTVFYLGEPLLFQWAAALNFGKLSDAVTINIHPMVFAAWFGMLATALNLLPFGQLDGGHITYATLRRWSTPISLMTLMMVVMLVLLGPRHPRVLWENEPLPTSRYLVAVLALVIFIICFTPVPIDTLISS